MKRSGWLLGFVASAGFLAAPLLAQDAPSGGAKPQDGALKAIHARMKADADAADRASGLPNQFGTQCCQVTQIPASSFQTRDSSTAWSYFSSGYIYATSNPIGDGIAFWATITLPSGVAIRYLDLWYDDTDVGNDISATIRVYTGLSSPGFFDVASVSSNGASSGPGYNTSGLFSHTVDNDGLLAGGQYTVIISLPASPSSSLRFKAVDLWWNRQISPAPVTQTFNDVAPADFGYQQIEAMVAAGITGGCGGGNYCPNSNLTRAQMAIFLSKALGLYWPF